jgi:hypothetical protein
MKTERSILINRRIDKEPLPENIPYFNFDILIDLYKYDIVLLNQIIKHSCENLYELDEIVKLNNSLFQWEFSAFNLNNYSMGPYETYKIIGPFGITFLNKGFNKYNPLSIYINANISKEEYIKILNTHLNATEILLHEQGHALAKNHIHTDPQYRENMIGLSSGISGNVYPTILNTLSIINDPLNNSLAWIE